MLQQHRPGVLLCLERAGENANGWRGWPAILVPGRPTFAWQASGARLPRTGNSSSRSRACLPLPARANERSLMLRRARRRAEATPRPCRPTPSTRRCSRPRLAMLVAAPARGVAGGVEDAGVERQQRRHRLVHGDAHVLAEPGRLARVERGQYALRRIQSRREIGNRHAESSHHDSHQTVPCPSLEPSLLLDHVNPTQQVRSSDWNIAVAFAFQRGRH